MEETMYDGELKEMAGKLRQYYSEYRTLRMRLIHFRNRKAEMEKRKALEHAEAYAMSIEDTLLQLHNTRGCIRLAADIVRSMKEAS